MASTHINSCLSYLALARIGYKMACSEPPDSYQLSVDAHFATIGRLPSKITCMSCTRYSSLVFYVSDQAVTHFIGRNSHAMESSNFRLDHAQC